MPRIGDINKRFTARKVGTARRGGGSIRGHFEQRAWFRSSRSQNRRESFALWDPRGLLGGVGANTTLSQTLSASRHRPDLSHRQLAGSVLSALSKN